MSRSAGVLDTKLRAAKKRQSQPMKRNNRKTKQNQIKSWMSCWRVELQRSRSCTLMGIIKIFFKALLFNVVWTEIEFLNKKKKKKKNVYLQPLISYFLILQQKKLLSDDRIAFQSRTRYIHYDHHHFIRLFIQDELLDDKWIPSLWDEKFNWYTRWNFPFF